jgi:hypothetical protein
VRRGLASIAAVLTPADHQTHRRYPFEVPPGCTELHVEVRYAPKYLPVEESRELQARAISAQAEALAARVAVADAGLVADWARAWTAVRDQRRLANLLTLSLDDARGSYRGAGHRQAAEQHLVLGRLEASPGLVAGPVPAGPWRLTVSVHTLVSARCELSIQIGAETASSEPSAPHSTA